MIYINGLLKKLVLWSACLVLQYAHMHAMHREQMLWQADEREEESGGSSSNDFTDRLALLMQAELYDAELRAQEAGEGNGDGDARLRLPWLTPAETAVILHVAFEALAAQAIPEDGLISANIGIGMQELPANAKKKEWPQDACDSYAQAIAGLLNDDFLQWLMVNTRQDVDLIKFAIFQHLMSLRPAQAPLINQVLEDDGEEESPRGRRGCGCCAWLGRVLERWAEDVADKGL